MSTFLANYPLTILDDKFCYSCYEPNTQMVKGVRIDYMGFHSGYICQNCKGFSYEREEGNPFDLLHEKLDKLLDR